METFRPFTEAPEMKFTPEQLEQRRRTRAKNKERRARNELAHAVIDAGFRSQAKRCHPDVGGSHEAMLTLTAVCDRLHEMVGDAKRRESWWVFIGGMF
jgi:hypothetical protein